MCDLLGLCFSRFYMASRSLPLFAGAGMRRGDMDGWGIGFYFPDGSAHVEKCAEEAWTSEKYQVLARVVKSNVFIAHLRLASRGRVCDEFCHPFKLHFRGRDWLFAHNGDCSAIVNYRTSGERIPGVEGQDSPRIFEFLRDHILRYLQRNRKGSLIGAVKWATEKLFEEYPNGTFNFLLTNGDVLFAHVDRRHSLNNNLYVLRREKEDGLAILVTTINGLTREAWTKFFPIRGRGKLLVMSEGELLYNIETQTFS
ncbi:MAG: class II glutamine amidotransferase [Candidatus Freyarchaeota archaeon]|nr:class II glutamine amidotransferase [Candidatus Freyrarchaeum guaymaensis]